MEHRDNLIPDSERDILAQYRQFKNELSEVSRKLIEIQSDKSAAATAQRRDLFARQDALRANIFKLIPFNITAFEKYAERMLGVVRNTILGNVFMSDCIINWATMDDTTLRQFGTLLLNRLENQYRESDTTVEFLLEPENADSPEMRGGYDWDKTIYIYICIYNNKSYFKNPDEFIGALLHEYIHYLCVKHPGNSPLGKQFALIAARHYKSFLGGPKNQKEFDEYKNQPFERPAYQIQEYIATHGFCTKLRGDIIFLRSGMQNPNTI